MYVCVFVFCHTKRNDTYSSFQAQQSATCDNDLVSDVTSTSVQPTRATSKESEVISVQLEQPDDNELIIVDDVVEVVAGA